MPLLQSEHKFTLVKLFALRRPRVAPWWLGLMLLGDDVAIFDRIHSYLCTLQERANFPCLSTPDTTVAAWTGSAQSYLDDSVPTDVHHTESQSSESRIISRADQLRHRYLFLRQDPGWTYSAWRPFGSVPMKNVESELWPQLELEYSLEYVDWIWWTKDGNDVQKGYRHDVANGDRDMTLINALRSQRHSWLKRWFGWQ
ncbi:hypothetical protein SODALDRAFT_65589 [Sodiomyces alkalinus F11]|uniref:Uncharacterized protein n=1 Tax=Sodiomyces alkalinus (strain CBS 110278 / VKM F-3762 / F11) TaxID=1314773 RepID=A0A3N2PLQ5_SODAK|nr:hypothetical protein SODALDRAFT_65589 [Sodiomyces alkalinus F11]ROT35419.1 hypothetical protein SODALDRAFT_65589 [Sodiomyces alkalinus F11]